MRYIRFALLAVLLAVPFAATAHSQVAVGVGVGPAVVAAPYAYGPPACEWGYYSYYPYACAPYGYYGPSWFSGGIFIGAGPWYHWGYGRGWGGYGYRGGYGYGYRGGYGYGGHGYVGRGYAGGYAGGRGYVGGARPGGGYSGGFHGGGGYGGGFHAGGGGGFHGGGGGGFHGGGGHR